MTLTGSHLINGDWIVTKGDTFQAVNPANNESLPTQFTNASEIEIEAAVSAATVSFKTYSGLSDLKRALFLESIAEEIDSLKESIIERGMLETGLPNMRLQGELGRTTGQLRMFSSLLKEGGWKRAVIDTADVERQPMPKPDVRLTQIPLGPVVVFAASNFPLAFSVAGGDTASALAAGCPVILKAHSGHPGTSELVALCIAKAIEKCGLPKGVFALLHSTGYELGTALVKHPDIKAAGFTGSIAGGRALYDLAANRPDPIPFYGELGSTNPVFMLQGALDSKAEQIAEGFVATMNLGVGQFCTSPGLIVACEGEGLEKFLSKAAQLIQVQQAQTMLTPAICSSYKKIISQRDAMPVVTTVAANTITDENANQAVLKLQTVKGRDYLLMPDLEEEVFGPSGLVVICEDKQEMINILESFHGHLTGAIFNTDDDQEFASALTPALQHKVGRVIFNGFGNGVEVCGGISHGGPYPSSTSVQTTSVGARAIDRFVRPICFQNTPDALLPDELKDTNPLNILRLVNNDWTRASI